MSLLRSPGTLTLALAAVSALVFAFAPFPARAETARREVHMVAVTDMTAAAAARPTPSPEHPAFYLVENLGFRVFGAEGPKENPPAPDDVIRTVAKVIARHGYLPLTKAHPPTVVLRLAWGTMNAEIEPAMAVSDAANGDTIEAPEFQTNRDRLLRFLGGYKVGLMPNPDEGTEPRQHLFVDYGAEVISSLSREDLYVVAILAYDFAALQRKQKVLLWTTKIACPAAGLTLADALPTLITMAGPYIGHETARPVSVWEGERRTPDVRVGDPKLIDFLDADSLRPNAAPESDRTAKPARK